MCGQFQVTLMELWREGADIFDVRPTPLQSVANQTACRFKLFKHYSVRDSWLAQDGKDQWGQRRPATPTISSTIEPTSDQDLYTNASRCLCKYNLTPLWLFTVVYIL
jgi:hypothetical protein